MKLVIRSFISAAVLLSLVLMVGACARPGDDKANIETKGGVDVGNMTEGLVPNTNASIGVPKAWTASTKSESLLITNASGSEIQARKSEITDLVSPTQLSLQKYLKTKHPDRDYALFNVAGLTGVRADLVNTTASKTSDIYLLSELNDFIHIESRLKSTENGITEGEAIISTVRVKYLGVPFTNQAPKTVSLEARSGNGDGAHYAYSFVGDCFTYDYKNCPSSAGTAVAYEREFSVGTSGYSHGRVVELGADSKVPFDSIKVDRDSLVAPAGTIPLSDIYTVFTPKDPKQDQNRVQLRAGYTYLVRTINWPEEDVITKMHIDSLDLGKSVTITYEKLVYVPEIELKKQVDQAIEFTKKYEQPLLTGEVTLHNRSVTNNYFYAAFNFEYSTSGNMFITRNGWDLLFEGSAQDASFNVPHTGSSIGEVVDLGIKDLAAVSASDFPDPNTYSRKRARVVKGHTYAIYHYDGGNSDTGKLTDGLTWGAVQVIDIDKDAKWVQLKFRRLKISAPDHFQKWLPLRLPTDVIKTTLTSANDNTSRFYPFIMKRGDAGSHYYEDMDYDFYEGPKLRTDPRPFGPGRGFKKIGSAITADNFTLADIETHRGQFQRDIELSAGDLIAGYFKNYYDLTVVVIRVESVNPDKSVNLSMRYLARAKTAYSDDKD